MAHFAIQEYKYRKNWIVSQIETLVVYICSEIDKSLVLFPELNSRLPKFAIGIY